MARRVAKKANGRTKPARKPRPRQAPAVAPGLAYEQVAVGDLSLIMATYNPRKIGAHDFAALRRSLRTFGAVEPVVVNRRTQRLVGGHQRVRAAEAEGIAALPVAYVDLDETAERQLNLALNRISGDWEKGALEAVLRELKLADADMALTGFDAIELQRWMGETRADGDTDPDAVPEVPKKATTKPGDLWRLGSHRLLCGDATDPKTVERLLAGEDAPALMTTDPPYGIGVDHTWRDGLRQPIGAARTGRVANDDRVDWTEVYQLCQAPVAYVWHSAMYCGDVKSHLEAAGFDVRQQIIWVKAIHSLGRAAYQWKHEPAWYAVRKGAQASWKAGRDQTTVWEAASPIMAYGGGKDDARTEHPTQKPVVLFETPIANHTSRGDLVFDPFLGSGTAVIASERLDRRCFGLELDPRYADVAIERWQNFTGEKAKRGTA